MLPLWWRISLILNLGGFMNDVELVELLTEARRSSRLQLLELLSARIEHLEADNATREQIISMLKNWISARQNVGASKSQGAAL
jgi:hypothetical protein